MRKPGKIFSVYGFTPGIAPAGNYGNGWDLLDNNNEFYLHRIIWDVQGFETLTQHPLNMNIQTEVVTTLAIGNLGVLACNPVSNVALPAGITSNGAYFVLSTPGVIVFDYFFVANTLPLFISFTNQSLGTNYAFYYSCIFEIETI